MVDIFFKDKDLERLCGDERFMKKKLGAPGARKLRTRLAELMAAEDLSELPAGHPKPLKGDRLGQFSVRLDGGRRLIFEAVDDPLPRTADGEVDWFSVREICIVEVGDYHD